MDRLLYYILGEVYKEKEEEERMENKIEPLSICILEEERQYIERTVTGRINDARFFIMLGVPRKTLLEKGFSQELLAMAYSHYSEERVEQALIRRITKLIKDNKGSKEDILRKGYSEEEYEKAKQKVEAEANE